VGLVLATSMLAVAGVSGQQGWAAPRPVPLPGATAVAGQATAVTWMLPVILAPREGAGRVQVMMAGRRWPAEARVVGSRRHRTVAVQVFVPRTVAAGHEPVIITWTDAGHTQNFSSVLRIPALFFAEQNGIFEDNLLGHAVPLSAGAFRQATQPTGIAYDPGSQRVYVSDANAGAIFVYTTTGRLVQTLNPPALLQPTYFTLAPAQQRLFVYQNGGDTAQIGLLALTLGGQVVPWRGHPAFRSIFALGNAITYDGTAHILYVSRALTSSQIAAGAPPVVAYNAVTGERIPTPGAFHGASPFPHGLVYVGRDNTVYVAGQVQAPDDSHYVMGFDPNGRPATQPGAFPVGEANTGSANAIVYNPLTQRLLVIGDTSLHQFTLAGQPVPPLTSRTDSATPLANLGHGGLVGATLAY